LSNDSPSKADKQLAPMSEKKVNLPIFDDGDLSAKPAPTSRDNDAVIIGHENKWRQRGKNSGGVSGNGNEVDQMSPSDSISTTTIIVSAVLIGLIIVVFRG
jgi:hypothetical protein